MHLLLRPVVLALAVILAACSSSPVRPDGEGVVRQGDIVSGTGTVRFYSFEGGFFAVRGDDEVTYDPLNLAQAFRQDGLRVYFRARLRDDIGGFHMAGPIVELIDIRRL